MAKESKMSEALREAAMNMIFSGCDALTALEGHEGAEDRAHDMVDWHFNGDDEDEGGQESSLSN